MAVAGRVGGRTKVRMSPPEPQEDCCPAVLSTPLTEPRAEELARAFGVLADPARLRLLSLLASAESGEVCVCELVGPLGRSQPTVSHHLKVLRDAGVVDSERRGLWAYYYVLPDALQELSSWLK